MVVTLHHLNNSRSQRVLWLLEELGVEYDIKFYQRQPDMLAPPELLEVHPLGKSPVITDNGKTIAETGAIIEYLVDKYGPQLKPPQSDEDLHLRYIYWLHFGDGSIMPYLIVNLVFGLASKQAPWIVRPIARAIAGAVNKGFTAPNIKRQSEFMEAELAKNPENWFVKDFSAADIALSFPIENISSAFGVGAYPKLAKWLTTIHDRPAYKRALEKGGPYET